MVCRVCKGDTRKKTHGELSDKCDSQTALTLWESRDRGEDVIGFIRYGCADGLALMP